MNFSALIPGLIDHIFLVSDFRQLPCRDFLQFSHSFSTAAFASGICNAWNSSVSQWCDMDDVCVLLLPALVSCFRRHQQYKRIVSWISQRCSGFLLCSLQVFCKVLAAGIGTSNFLRAALIVSLNSSSFGTIKNIPLNCHCRVLVSRQPIFVLLSFLLDRTNISTYMATHRQDEKFLCILVSLSRDNVYPSGGLSFIKRIL